jgi:hypothetical protein
MPPRRDAMDEDEPATTTWEKRAAAVLGADPLLVVEARSERPVPAKGPVMLAVAAGRIAVLPGERNEAPAVDAPATVMWFADIVKPPAVRLRKHGATVELKTANADVRLAAPLEALHAIVDAFGAAPRTAAARAPAVRAAPAVAAARPFVATLRSPPAPEPDVPERAAEQPALPAPRAAAPPKPAPSPARAPVGYDVHDGLLVPRRPQSAPEE